MAWGSAYPSEFVHSLRSLQLLNMRGTVAAALGVFLSIGFNEIANASGYDASDAARSTLSCEDFAASTPWAKQGREAFTPEQIKTVIARDYRWRTYIATCYFYRREWSTVTYYYEWGTCDLQRLRAVGEGSVIEQFSRVAALAYEQMHDYQKASDAIGIAANPENGFVLGGPAKPVSTLVMEDFRRINSEMQISLATPSAAPVIVSPFPSPSEITTPTARPTPHHHAARNGKSRDFDGGHPKPTATPTSTGQRRTDGHAVRAAIKEYWERTQPRYIAAYVWIERAQTATTYGDTVSASNAIERARELAEGAVTEAAVRIPDGLEPAARLLRAGWLEFKRGLDDLATRDLTQPGADKPAAERVAVAEQYFKQAYAEMQTRYTYLGGDPKNLTPPL